MLARAICLTANGVMLCQPGIPFSVLVANFSSEPQMLKKGHNIATTSQHPDATVNSSFTLDDVLGLTKDAPPKPTSSAENGCTECAKSQMYRHCTHKATNVKWTTPEASTISHDNVNLDHIDDEFHPRIRAMLAKHSTMWDGSLGEITTMKQRIDLKEDAKPHYCPPYRAGPKHRVLEQTEIQRQLSVGVIEPNSSPWGTSIVFAPKKDGTLRFCLDYRRLNACNIRDTYPLLRMNESIGSLGSARVF